ncbi:hypothetical protein D6853_14015 [Butyrivibrio sp. X503]|uniref:DUF6036 family nucleotidyltransferase n=1 Tax=Butyrivibrio sp. X503 TaxID=2364878 RepID=UPI000EA91FE0|nr:DUF6036 family nucleotidyltransferase [Butyrivibrio sp. X503]RKM54337.1 hypothetical protein D6853_14015 [Butyrivibrio sp. X503]
MDEIFYSKDNLDNYLKQLGKVYRQLNGKNTEAEIVLIGGAAIVSGFGFRYSTTDIDAYIIASSALKDAINIVGDENGLKPGWLNDDFKHTASYSDKIPLYSVHYRTFSNILHVRTMPGAYIAAMKLASYRPYKYDRSDVIGVILEDDLQKEDIITAINNLYGSIDALRHSADVKKFLDEIYKSDDLKRLYDNERNEEKSSFTILKNAEKYGEKLSTDNIEDVIKQARKRAAEKRDNNT